MDKNNDLLNKIDMIISDTENYEKAIKVNNGDILIRNKNKKKKDLFFIIFISLSREWHFFGHL